MSVAEAVGALALAHARGSGQFSDRFGHQNCIILAIMQTLNSPLEQLTR